MKLGILLCGHVPEPLAPRFGDYAAMVQRLLDPAHQVSCFDVTAGVLPASAESCDAFVLTGSPAAVYDELPWIAPLADFVRSARGRAKLVGICFGHQMMAHAFGGRVVKAPQGWGIGLHRYALPHRAAWMDDADMVVAPASHQDQVVECAADAGVVAQSVFTPFAGLDYGDAISFQFHPEFSAAFGVALIESRRDLYGARGQAAIDSYTRPHDGARVARWIGRFLQMPMAAMRPAA